MGKILTPDPPAWRGAQQRIEAVKADPTTHPCPWKKRAYFRDHVAVKKLRAGGGPAWKP